MGVIAAERRRFGGWTFEIGEESGSATAGEVGVWLVKAPAGSGLATGPLNVVKLAEWARANGVHPKTAYRWWREGILPVPARKVGPARSSSTQPSATAPSRSVFTLGSPLTISERTWSVS